MEDLLIIFEPIQILQYTPKLYSEYIKLLYNLLQTYKFVYMFCYST